MTELQQTLLDFIAAHQEERGEAPSSDEIGRAFRYRNDTTVVRSLEALAAAGHVAQGHGRWRLRGPVVQLHLELKRDAPGGLPPR